jgi:uncharacterized protein (TIGR03067 family)
MLKKIFRRRRFHFHFPRRWRYDAMRLAAMIFAFGVILSPSRAAEKPDDRADTEKLQGVWRGRSIDAKGLSLMPSSAYNLLLRFDKDSFTVEQEGQVTVRGTFALDPAQKPRTIDLTLKETVQTVNKGAVVRGIYEIDKDGLRLCTTKANGEDRPKRFVSKSGTPHTLFTFQREKGKTPVSKEKK